ncbi:unnamed protein product [Rotaria sordida]|uniref:Uncharacterized protein n=1 Tax=Rotaria sordida TaxID=392033 RepID=A0A813NNX9_9BILA|nr:unnamed protein product [Rotaria sordida]
MPNQEFTSESPAIRSQDNRDANNMMANEAWQFMGQVGGRVGSASGTDLARGAAAVGNGVADKIGDKVNGFDPGTVLEKVDGYDPDKDIGTHKKDKGNDMCIDLTINIFEFNQPKGEPGVEHKNSPFDKYRPHIGYGHGEIRPTQNK